MPEFTFLAIDEPIGHHAAWLAVELHLHGADATYVAIADLLSTSLATWDEQQRKRGGQRVITDTPRESDSQ